MSVIKLLACGAFLGYVGVFGWIVWKERHHHG